MKTFILLSAAPAAGKSTWAKNYAKNNDNVYIVSSDEIRKEITGSFQIFTQESQVWATFNERIHEFAKRHEKVTVIADAVNDSNSLRKMYAEATQYFDKQILVFFDKPYEVLVEQNHMRNPDKWVIIEALERIFKRLEKPSEEVIRLYDEYIYIN